MHRLQKLGIAKIDRATVFLVFLLFLFLWDAAYFVGIRDPVRFPHPFILFRKLGDIESLRGLPAMLREAIFCFGVGSVIGVATGSIILLNVRLVRQLSRFLRLIQWFPLVLIFSGSGAFVTESITAILSACYNYIHSRSVLGLQRRDSWIYTAREALLQTLLVTLIAQLWISRWQWSTFTILMQVRPGFEAFATLVALVGAINWCFQATFDVTARRHAAVTNYLIESEGWKATYEFSLLAIACLLIWQVLSALSLSPFVAPPSQGLNAIYDLFLTGEIWGDMGLSLLEVMAGIISGALAAEVVFLALRRPILRKVLFPLLPVTRISLIVLWLIVFVVWARWFQMKESNFLYFWHKVIAVGCLSFFPLIESLWGARDRPLLCRFVLAIEAALPVAFVAMAFGEAYAATKGLGFSMIVASATGQRERAVGVALITFALLVGLSFTLRWTAKRLCGLARTPDALPVT
jgi:ABC-type nitrate/sulfonate/bicarbonate transport system permease component